MATLRNIRIMALLVQQAAENLYTEIGTVYGATSLWNLTGPDEDLPPEGDVKGLITQYSQIQPNKLNVQTALSDVLASEDEATPGIFALPSTSSVITYPIEGPIPLNVILGQQGVGAAMQIFRVSLYAKQVDAGDNLLFDILCNDVSILPSAISVPPGSDQVILVNASELITTTLASGDILSYTATAGSANTISPSLWITPNE